MKWTISLLAVVLATFALPGRAAQGTAAAAANAAPAVPSDAVKKAVEDHVQARMLEGNGVYRLKDELTGEVLELVFEHTGIVAAEGVWSVHDPSSRAPGGEDYFACTVFHPAHGPADRGYDLDFRVVREHQSFAVREVTIHRDGKRVDGQWVWTPRQPQPQPVGTGSGS